MTSISVTRSTCSSVARRWTKPAFGRRRQIPRRRRKLRGRLRLTGVDLHIFLPTSDSNNCEVGLKHRPKSIMKTLRSYNWIIPTPEWKCLLCHSCLELTTLWVQMHGRKVQANCWRSICKGRRKLKCWERRLFRISRSSSRRSNWGRRTPNRGWIRWLRSRRSRKRNLLIRWSRRRPKGSTSWARLSRRPRTTLRPLKT